MTPPHSRGVDCPMCAAKAGQRCIGWAADTQDTYEMHRPHPARTAKAKRLGVVVEGAQQSGEAVRLCQTGVNVTCI